LTTARAAVYDQPRCAKRVRRGIPSAEGVAVNERSARSNLGPALLGIALALGLIISTSIAMRTVEKIKITNRTITVKGYAEKEIVSDWARWEGSFKVKTTDLVAGYGKLEADLDKVMAYLTSEGVRRDDLVVSSVSTTTQHKLDEEGRRTNEIEAYFLYQSVTVASSDTALIDRIARGSTVLIKQGVEFSSNHPEFLYTKLDELKIEMLGEATKDARERAEQLAVNSRGRVGALRSASQGVFQITPRHSTEVSSRGMYSTSTVEKKITAVVTIVYSIR
jgi:hypothetical protein